MANIQHQYTVKKKRQLRIRSKVQATAERPKLTFTRSNRYLYMQVIDNTGKVLAAANDMALLKKGTIKKGTAKTARGEETAKVLLSDLKKKKITTLTVDRGSYRYTGRVKAAVEIIRSGGVEV